jgi:hypothetical protein
MDNTSIVFVVMVYRNGIAIGLNTSRYPPAFYLTWDSAIADSQVLHGGATIPVCVRYSDAIYLPR